MSYENFNYNITGELPDGGAPIFGDDISKVDFKLTKSMISIMKGMFDYEQSEIDKVGDQTFFFDGNYVVHGCNTTVTSVTASNTYNLAITEGLVKIGDDLIAVAAQNLNYEWQDFTNTGLGLGNIALRKTTTNESRIYKNSTTNITKVINTATLTTTSITNSDLVFTVTDTTAEPLRLVNQMNQWQIKNQAVRYENDTLNPLNSVWEFGTGSKQIVKSHGQITYTIKFKCIDSTTHNNSTTKRVWQPKGDYYPANEYKNWRGSAVSEVSGNDYTNDVIVLWNNGWFSFDKVGPEEFEDDEIVYFSFTLRALS